MQLVITVDACPQQSKASSQQANDPNKKIKEDAEKLRVLTEKLRAELVEELTKEIEAYSAKTSAYVTKFDTDMTAALNARPFQADVLTQLITDLITFLNEQSSNLGTKMSKNLKDFQEKMNAAIKESTRK